MSKSLSAVLTGDLVSSRAVSAAAVDGAMATLQAAADDFGAAWDQGPRFTRHRGDGWQILLDDPALAVRAMLFLRARLRASGARCDTRIAAGIGAVTRRGTRDLSDGAGEAFHVSGDGLEAAGKRRLVLEGRGIGDWQMLALRLLDAIVEDWTPAQAEAAAFALLSNMTQEDIAAHLGITRQAVQLRLAGAKMRAIEDAVQAFERHRTPQ